MDLERLISGTLSRSPLFCDAEYFDGDFHTDLRISVERDVEYIGQSMQSMGRRTEVTLIKSKVPAPKRGDTITLEDGTVWEVTAVLSDDDTFVTVSVK